jgi:hypothetical protein
MTGSCHHAQLLIEKEVSLTFADPKITILPISTFQVAGITSNTLSDDLNQVSNKCPEGRSKNSEL